MNLLRLILRFKWRVALTMSLVIVEAIVELLFPLIIGIAINGLLEDNRSGVMALGGLGVTALVVGSARRFVDTRAYAGVYETVANEVTERGRRNGTPTSTVAGRATLLVEFIEFLENSMPAIVTMVIGTTGTIVIVAGINLNVFWACLALLELVIVVYALNGRLSYELNQGYNDELEQQVTAIDSQDPTRTAQHFASMMRWNIKLSDLETVSYIAIWLGVIGLLVYAPIQVIDPGQTEYGFAFAAIIYVFQYIEALVTLPLYIQQTIRLQEISRRLETTQADRGEPSDNRNLA